MSFVHTELRMRQLTLADCATEDECNVEERDGQSQEGADGAEEGEGNWLSLHQHALCSNCLPCLHPSRETIVVLAEGRGLLIAECMVLWFSPFQRSSSSSSSIESELLICLGGLHCILLASDPLCELFGTHG